MKINIAWMIKNGCEGGVEWFQSNFEGWVEGKEAIQRCMEDGLYSDANRGIVKLMAYEQYVKYAVYAAKQVLDIYEKRYPYDKSPRQTIQAAQKCIKTPSKQNKASAASATYAASAASADSADSVAYAAYAASATSAAYAAYAASADSAAYAAHAAYAASVAYADYAAERKKMQIKILKYGLRLLKNNQ